MKNVLDPETSYQNHDEIINLLDSSQKETNFSNESLFTDSKNTNDNSSKKITSILNHDIGEIRSMNNFINNERVDISLRELPKDEVNFDINGMPQFSNKKRSRKGVPKKKNFGEKKINSDVFIESNINEIKPTSLETIHLSSDQISFSDEEGEDLRRALALSLIEK